MNFVSWAFVALFLIVLTARLTIGRRSTEPAFVLVLVVASIGFYAWHIPVYIGILLLSSGIDYWAALWLARLPPAARGRRRAVLGLSLCTNLGLLAFFKYASFFLQVMRDVLGPALTSPLPPELALALPMGISFYTFQSMSYTIDVYRGVLAPIHRFWPFFLFVSFFPQLVAGPIVRAAEFLPQMPRPRPVRAAVFYEGAWLIISGFFLKMVCADNLGMYVDEYWDRGTWPQAGSGFTLWLALMFSGQIFADFAGYSNIARGTAYLLGYRLPINFNAPYLAASFKNFWERWHMTLSRWLRDYLYVPLGGNRRSAVRTYVNLLLVMLLGGLWHGAAYTFIIWGGLHGAALAIERLLGLQRPDGWAARWPVRATWFLVVQALVLVAWVFFRSRSVEEASLFLGNIGALDGWRLGATEWVGALFLAPLVAHHAFTWLVERQHVPDAGPVARAVLAAFMVYAIAALYTGTSDFIYFQF
ncbi:MAG TPA: MBOAT family O-acyltransferase [Vicinamibacterales bacterium]|nr:MBOAT family O-acyltransferase [Vicinamibacterales bacterium]